MLTVSAIKALSFLATMATGSTTMAPMFLPTILRSDSSPRWTRRLTPETEKAREEFFKRAALRNIPNTVYGMTGASSDKSKSNNDISKPKMTHGCPGIKKVIFNDPATIVLWDDGTKTVVKCSEGDTYSE